MNIRVLLVDDERDFLDALSKRLISRGYIVQTAQSGQDALTILLNSEIDVVILDVQMPGKDGMTVLHEMKRYRPLVEVIMLTGQASVQKAVHGMKAGAFDYITKPAELDDLLEKISGAYKRKTDREERVRGAKFGILV